MNVTTIRTKLKKPLPFWRSVFGGWFHEDLFTQAAAAGYYAVFSLPGLILVATAIASLVFERSLVQDEVDSIIQSIIGRDLTFNVRNALENSEIMGRQSIAFAIGFLIILYGASRFFMQLQKSLNHVFGVTPKKKPNVKTVLKKRLSSLVLVLCSGFVLLVLLSVSSLLSAFQDYLALQLPLVDINLMLLLNWGVSYCVVVGMFTALYKIVPDVRIQWRCAFMGALLSAILFMAGQGAVNYYFAVANPQSVFGAAGSIILLMLWVSYAFMILMFGAHVTRTHMESVTGRQVEPDREVAEHNQL